MLQLPIILMAINENHNSSGKSILEVIESIRHVVGSIEVESYHNPKHLNYIPLDTITTYNQIPLLIKTGFVKISGQKNNLRYSISDVYLHNPQKK
jgi:hypothetical protein